MIMDRGCRTFKKGDIVKGLLITADPYKKIHGDKKQYALSQGYYYLAISYWTEQDESYKTLIDDKINEILIMQN